MPLRNGGSAISPQRESHLLGIDIGGTKIGYALGTSSGRLLARRRRPTEPSGRPLDDLERIAADARRLLAETGVSREGLTAVGVTAPGPLDVDTGVVLTPPNLPGWNGVPVSAHLADALGCPVFLDNDANAAALAEGRWGAAQGLSHFVFLTMSTGVGGGLVLGGRLYRGVLASAGEIGHAPVEWGGEPCVCGLRGCLEAYAGGAAWTRRLAATTPANSRVAALAGGAERARPEHVVAAARDGDAFACAELARWSDYVARGIVWLVMVLAPEAIVLGTIAVAAGDLVFEPIRRQVAANVWPHLAPRLRIVPAALGAELPYLAGLSVALEGLRGELPAPPA